MFTKMHTQFIYKLQLVSLGGLMLSEIPKSEDVAASQLSGGIMSAIMSFSKEVHQREIASLAYHDRNIIFASVGEFYLITEVTTAVNTELLNKLIAVLKEKSIKYFEGYDQMSLRPHIADEKLLEIYNSDWFHGLFASLGVEQSLLNAKQSVFKISGDYKTMEFNGSSEEITIACEMIKNHSKYNLDPPIFCGFVMMRELNRGAFVVSIRGDNTRGGILSVSEDKISNLFKLTPLFTTIFRSQYDKNNDINIPELLDLLSQIHDVSDLKKKDLSSKINLLDIMNNKIKDLDKIIFQTIIGNRIVITGQKENVVDLINTIDMFTSHQITEIVVWLEDDEIGKNITGMSLDKFTELSNANKIESSVMVVNLDDNKLSGNVVRSNKFIKKLIDRTKKLSYKQAYDIIANELELIVSYGINVTTYTPQTKDILLSNLQDMKGSIGDGSQYDLIQNLASRLNTWLRCVIYDQSYDTDWI